MAGNTISFSGLLCNIPIDDYQLIEEYSAGSLITEVNKLRSKGYFLYGPSYILHCGGGSTIIHHYQAMVKIKK